MSIQSSSKLVDQSVSVILSRGLIDVTVKKNGINSCIIEPPFRLGKLKHFIDDHVIGEDFQHDIHKELDYMLTVFQDEMKQAADWIEQQAARPPEPDRGYIAIGYAFAGSIGFVLALIANSVWGGL